MVEVVVPPLWFVDPTGKSINLAWLQAVDQMLKTNYTLALINDLSSQTGLNYSINNGMLSYDKDETGNAVVATDTYGNQIGSVTARIDLIGAIDHQDEVGFAYGKDNFVKMGTNTIHFNFDEINAQINGAVGVDNKTLGYGMTFLHELQHTNVGGGMSDAPYSDTNPGPVVTHMNTVRSELDTQGGNYGQRMTYESYTLLNGNSYLPFSTSARSVVQKGLAPLSPLRGMPSSSRYIIMPSKTK